MRRYSTEEKRILALAYFHRYGWIVMLLFMIIPQKQASNYCVSISFIAYSIWTFVGYKLKWRHIYCSYQNAYHKRMTPHSIHWKRIKKSDAYGVPLIFFVLGTALLCMTLLR